MLIKFQLIADVLFALLVHAQWAEALWEVLLQLVRSSFQVKEILLVCDVVHEKLIILLDVLYGADERLVLDEELEAVWNA